MKIISLQAYIIQKITPAMENLAYVQIDMGWFTGTAFSGFLMVLTILTPFALAWEFRIYIGFSFFFSKHI